MNSKEELPVVLVIGNQEHNAEELIKGIIGVESLTGVQTKQNIMSYLWNIDNQYYSANIILCAINSKRTSLEPFVSYVEAFIVFESQVTENTLKELNDWSQVIDICLPAIRLYVCQQASPNRRDKIEQWCIQNQFEFVEIDTGINEKNSALEFNENCGIDRVIEVLQAHQWPSMNLKSKIMHGAQGITSKLVDTDNFHITANEYRTKNESLPTNSSKNDEISVDNFEELSTLFQNLQSVKEKISSLSREEKLREAEVAVKAFWRAISGDSDEFSDNEEDNARNLTK